MRTRIAVTSVSRLGLVFLLSIPLATSQGYLPNRGQKVYVVGVKDGRGLTCVKACSPMYPLNRPPLLDRFAPDEALQTAARKEFRKEGRYVLVDSPENADFVFIIEGLYVTESILTARAASSNDGSSLAAAGPLDQKPNRLSQVAAIAVPASIYRAAPTDWQTLFQARIWGGCQGSTIVNASAGSPGSVRETAKPETLVKMFPGKGLLPPGSPPFLCMDLSSALTMPQLDTGVILSGVATPAPPQPAQKISAGSSIKVDVDFVSVPVSATDADGKYIPDLKVSDFHVYEDNVAQAIDRLVTAEEPLNAALMIDSSWSVALKLDQAQQAALSFVETKRPEDRLMVVSFDDRIHLDSEFTSDRLALRRAILGTRQAIVTRLYDAVDLVLSERLNAVVGRKAIVLFTDGVDTSSWLKDSGGTLTELEESNVTLYAIQLETKNDDTPRFQQGWIPAVAPAGMAKSEQLYAYGSQYLQDLATRSGGRLFHAATMGNAIDAFVQVADELHHQYVLGYYPSNRARDGSYRNIRVTVDRPGVRIRARNSYRAGTQSSGK